MLGEREEMVSRPMQKEHGARHWDAIGIQQRACGEQGKGLGCRLSTQYVVRRPKSFRDYLHGQTRPPY